MENQTRWEGVWGVKRSVLASGIAYDGRTRPLEAAVASRPKN